MPIYASATVQHAPQYVYVTGTLHGVWHHLVCVNFPKLFTADKITKPCEEVYGPDINTKLKQCADVFLTYLLTQSHELCTKKMTLTIPMSVTQVMSVYQVESDFYKDYFTGTTTHQKPHMRGGP